MKAENFTEMLLSHSRCKLSGPANLNGFNDNNLLYASSGVMIISERVCVKLWPGKSILSMCSIVKMFLKNRLNTYAF